MATPVAAGDDVKCTECGRYINFGSDCPDVTGFICKYCRARRGIPSSMSWSDYYRTHVYDPNTDWEDP